jgi:hypothetical protein
MYVRAVATELTPAGLELIVSVYPVGIGLVVLEVFRLSSVRRTRLKFGLYSRASGFGLVLLCFPAVFAVLMAFWSAVDGLTVDGWQNWFIRFAGQLLGVSIMLLLVELLFMALALDRDPPASPRSPASPASPPAPKAPGQVEPKGKSTSRRRRRGRRGR